MTATSDVERDRAVPVDGPELKTAADRYVVTPNRVTMDGYATLWAFSVLTLDLLVLYGLTTHGGEFEG